MITFYAFWSVQLSYAALHKMYRIVFMLPDAAATRNPHRNTKVCIAMIGSDPANTTSRYDCFQCVTYALIYISCDRDQGEIASFQHH